MELEPDRPVRPALRLILLYYVPRAVWRSRLEPLVKIAVIGGVCGGLPVGVCMDGTLSDVP